MTPGSPDLEGGRPSPRSIKLRPRDPDPDTHPGGPGGLGRARGVGRGTRAGAPCARQSRPRTPADHWPSPGDARVGGGEAGAEPPRAAVLQLQKRSAVPRARCVPGSPSRPSPASHRSHRRLRERRPWPESLPVPLRPHADGPLPAPPPGPGPAPSADFSEDPRVQGLGAPWAVPALGFGAVLCSRSASRWQRPCSRQPLQDAGRGPSFRCLGGRPRLETICMSSATLASGCQTAVQVTSTGHPSSVGAGDRVTAAAS